VNIGVVGLGYVGIVSLACLSKMGFKVTGIDTDQKKVDALKNGCSYIYEPGVDKLIKDGLKKGKIFSSNEINSSINDLDLFLVCVGTPSKADGSHDYSYIENVTKEIAICSKKLKNKKVTVAFRSTFQPGTIDKVILPILDKYKATNVDVVYNPEFLRESTAIDDFFMPSRIVVGTSDGSASKHMNQIYKSFDAKIFLTKFKEAEITKLIDNTWHALKVSFMNEIARISETNEINISKIYDIFVADDILNISKHYLRPGGPFGGSCLPKDLRALESLSKLHKLNNPIIENISLSNANHQEYLVNKILHRTGKNKKILFCGVTFKRNTDDLRESPWLSIANVLKEQNLDFDIYDSYYSSNKTNKEKNTFLGPISEHIVSINDARNSKYDLYINANNSIVDLGLKSTNTVLDLNRLD